MTRIVGGIGLAKRTLAAFLAAELPEYLQTLRNERGLGFDELPTPDQDAFLPREPRALDRFPLIAVSGVATRNIRRLEIKPTATIEYVTRYNLRVFAWVRAEGWELTIDSRDNLITAARQLLLDRPLIRDDDVTHLEVEETSLTEDFSEVTPVKGDRYIAGAYLDLEVKAAEDLQPTTAGSPSTGGIVQAVNVDTAVLPHPALD